MKYCIALDHKHAYKMFETRLYMNSHQYGDGEKLQSYRPIWTI
jgi:hypothetical protein